MRLASTNRPDRPAVVDIGSNSVRLVVWDGREPIPTPLFNEKVTCGLGAEIHSTGRLSQDGVAMAMDCLPRFSRIAQNLAVDRIEYLATAAVREAEDGADFIDRARGLVDGDVRILPGDEEAFMIAEGVVWGAPRADGIIGDLGGGSLELIRVEVGAITQQTTLPLGPLRLAALGDSQSDAVNRHIDHELGRVDWLDLVGEGHLFAVGGSWRALAKVHMAWTNYPLRIIQGYKQPKGKIQALAKLLVRQTEASVSRITEISAKRQQMLPLAALTMSRVLSATRPGKVEFSAFGLREGWLCQQLPASARQEDPLLAFSCDYALRHGRFGDQGEPLFYWLNPLFPSETEWNRRLRRAVCHLMDIGWRAHPEYRARLTMERVLDWRMLPANHRERTWMALSLAGRFGGCPKPPIVSHVLSPEDQFSAQLLGKGLRLADALRMGLPDNLGRHALDVCGEAVNIQWLDGHDPITDTKVERRLRQLNKFIAESPMSLGVS